MTAHCLATDAASPPWNSGLLTGGRMIGDAGGLLDHTPNRGKKLLERIWQALAWKTYFLPLCALSILLGSFAVPSPAHATNAYNGIYVILDPYGAGDSSILKTASTTPCTAGPQDPPSSTFCGAVDGILLRVGWCDFQPDHALNGVGVSSCHYLLGFSKGVGSIGVQMPTSPIPEIQTPCAQNFDVCTPSGQSTMGTALGYIAKINATRATAGYPPLKLSVGLQAGIWTPNSVLTSVGSVDVLHNIYSGTSPQYNQCNRLPKVWQPAFVADYAKAVDQLLGFIVSQLPGAADVTILKASGIVANDLEVAMPGSPIAAPVPTQDPKSPSNGPGPPLSCSSTVAEAKTWLNTYNSAPVQGRTFSQAVEYSFGAIIGNEYASLANHGLSALLSIPNTGTNGFAQVDCGLSGSGNCFASSLTGNWSGYYLTAYVDDLFNGGLAGQAASAAYTAARPGHAYTMQPGELSLNWTALTAASIGASTQLTCTTNNLVPANDERLQLDGVIESLPGVGTTIGWQTQTLQGRQCASPGNPYMNVLNNGIAQGGQFLEVEEDAAVTHFNTCAADLQSASRTLMTTSHGTCQY